jgi:hypothetical protein
MEFQIFRRLKGDEFQCLIDGKPIRLTTGTIKMLYGIDAEAEWAKRENWSKRERDILSNKIIRKPHSFLNRPHNS